MFGFGRLGRARHEIRRLLSAAAVAFMLGLQAFSAITIAAEADHHCCGEECPVCFELQQCVANMLLTGSGLDLEPTTPERIVTERDFTPQSSVEPQHETLVSLKVRLDE